MSDTANPNPQEQYDSARTALFRDTPTVQTIAGTSHVRISTRSTPGNYPQLYNVATSANPNELFVYGGYVSEEGGAYVAKLDANSLSEIWRAKIELSDHWNYPGAVGVLADGNPYAVAGNVLMKVDAETGDAFKLDLPQHTDPYEGGAAYNGFVVNPDGVIFTKSLERGLPCNQNALNQNLGIACAAFHKIPSYLVAVDTKSGKPFIIDQADMDEFIMSRISTERRDGIDYIYCPGLTQLWRYTFDGKKLALDESWGPVSYAGSGQPGTAPAIMGDFMIIINNGFVSSDEPFTVRAISIYDSNVQFFYMPLDAYPMSQVGSKPAVDVENQTVYMADWKAQLLVCLDFIPNRGFETRWTQPQEMFCFLSLFGDAANRQVVGTDYNSSLGDQVVWRNAATGEEIVRSAYLDPMFNGSTVGPGYNGKFYYLAQTYKALVEMTPVAE